jgi:hypothetical protein
MDSDERFWMIWNPQGGRPTRKHPTRESAQAEATRLAMQSPGDSFYIMRAEAVAQYVTVSIRELEDGRPF